MPAQKNKLGTSSSAVWWAVISLIAQQQQNTAERGCAGMENSAMDNPLNTPKQFPPVSDPLVDDPVGANEQKSHDDEARWIWPATLLFIGFIVAVLGLATLAKDPDTRVTQNGSERSSPLTKPLVTSPPVPQ
jgi:hypothetical protein